MKGAFPTVEFGALEIGAMRMLFAYAVFRLAIPANVPFRAQPYPVGVARWLDLTFLSRPACYPVLKIFAWIALGVYAAGLERVLTTAYLFVFCTLLGTLRNSQGTIVHAKQMLSMVLLVQCVVYTTAATRALGEGRSMFHETALADRLAVLWSQEAILAVYFTAGLTKLIHSRGRWLRQVAKIPLQILKTSEQFHHDELKPVDLGARTTVATWLLHHRNATRTLFGLGLLAELCSPLCLFNQTTMLIGGAVLLLFHRLSAFCLRLHFHEAQMLLGIYLVNLPGWVRAMVPWQDYGLASR